MNIATCCYVIIKNRSYSIYIYSKIHCSTIQNIAYAYNVSDIHTDSRFFHKVECYVPVLVLSSKVEYAVSKLCKEVVQTYHYPCGMWEDNYTVTHSAMTLYCPFVHTDTHSVHIRTYKCLFFSTAVAFFNQKLH